MKQKEQKRERERERENKPEKGFINIIWRGRGGGPTIST